MKLVLLLCAVLLSGCAVYPADYHARVVISAPVYGPPVIYAPRYYPHYPTYGYRRY